jgi:hypothetical protein
LTGDAVKDAIRRVFRSYDYKVSCSNLLD